MPNTLVTYYSRTGNTKKIAEAIFEAIEGEKTLKSYQDLQPQEIQESQLVLVGFPVHSHGVPFAAEKIIKDIPQGKKTAFFSTHGSLTGSRLSREALEHATVLATKATVLGSFSCRGKVSDEALKILEKSPEHRAWAEMSASARTHPDKHDLEDARAFARWIQTLARQ
jgi:flavodoxin